MRNWYARFLNLAAARPLHDANDYKYTALEDGSIEITGYNGEDTNVIIPDEIDGKKVIRIESSAFEGCSSLTHIIIPEGITCIGNLMSNLS